MSTKNTTTRVKQNKSQNQRPGALNLLFKPIGIAVTCVFYLFISIIISTLIEWVGMTWWWQKNHAETVLLQEFSYLGDNFSMTLFGISAEQAAMAIITKLNGFLFGSSAFGGEPAMMVFEWLNTAEQGIKPYVNALIFIIMVTAIRCVVIILSSAMFLIIAIAAIVDGLHHRELRKVSGGVEHASIYHHAKSWISKIIVISPVLYLAWPGAINPNYILLPGMICFFFAVYISFATFKKFI